MPVKLATVTSLSLEERTGIKNIYVGLIGLVRNADA